MNSRHQPGLLQHVRTVLSAPSQLPLRIIIPVALLAFTVVLGGYSLWHNSRMVRAHAENDALEYQTRLLTNLQGTLDYLLRKNEIERVREEIAVLGVDPDVQAALLIDDQGVVIASIHQADLGRAAGQILPAPMHGPAHRQEVMSRAKATLTGSVHLSPARATVTGIYPVTFGAQGVELRPSRLGLIFLQRDIRPMLAREQRQVEQQVLEFSLLMALLALLSWAFFHFVLARRVNRLVTAAGQLAAGQLEVRSGLNGKDELSRVGQAFDQMAQRIAGDQARLIAKETQLRNALQAAQMGSWRWDMRTNTLVWSEGVGVLFGLTPDACPGTYEAYLQVIHPDDAPDVVRTIEQTVIQGGKYQVEHRVVWPDGSTHWLSGRGEVVRDTAGQAIEMSGLVWDISARKRAEETLFEAKERAEVTLHSIGDAVLTTDANGNVDYLNPIAEQLTGWSNAEAQHKPLSQVFQILNEITRAPIENPVTRVLRDGQIVGLANHTVLISRDGHELGIEDSAAPIRNRAGEIIGVVLVFHDVSQARQMATQLTWQASHDSLTGLINRREFENRVALALASARADGLTHTLLYLDLDQFKLVNDTCGHVAGDELLRQLSALKQKRMRASDTLARLGGDEFGLLLENCPLDQAQRIADNLRQVIKNFRFTWEGKSFEISASIGVVGVHADSGGLSDVLSAADMACYAAKEAGRNRVHVYRESDATLIQRHGEMLWVARVNQALEQDRFTLYRQSIMPADSASSQEGLVIDHYEVLLRLVAEDGGIIAPGTFIPAAERYNLMPAIDRWVVRSTLTHLQEHACPPMNASAGSGECDCLVAINLSGASLGDDDFLDFVRAQLAEHGIPPGMVCFEITETAAISNLARATQLITELRALGCRFSLDDFGAGLSSFGYLKNLPVDFLKIDGGLVKNIVDNPIDYAMVEAINDIGHVMGLRTIAEFVENDAIREKLCRLGVDYVQGYGIERPRPLAGLAHRAATA